MHEGFAPTPPITAVHQFSNEFTDLHKLRLVNADQHPLADPEAGIRQGQSVNDAVRTGFAAGILRMSEILFNSKHDLAAFNYSFVCGSLCGHGATVIFELKGGKWKQSGRNCGYWIS